MYPQIGHVWKIIYCKSSGHYWRWRIIPLFYNLDSLLIDIALRNNVIFLFDNFLVHLKQKNKYFLHLVHEKFSDIWDFIVEHVILSYYLSYISNKAEPNKALLAVHVDNSAIIPSIDNSAESHSKTQGWNKKVQQLVYVLVI